MAYRASKPDNPADKAAMERELEQSGTEMVQVAQKLTIANQADFEKANEWLREIKARMKQVEAYWKEPKAAAAAAHKTLVAREKEMLEPWQSAEKIIKAALLDYNKAVRQEREAAEAEARRQREAEMQRLNAIAEEAEAKGDDETAEIMRDMAESVPLQVRSAEVPTAKGLTIRETWKARVVDPKLVPAYWDNIEIRTIDNAVLNSLAKSTGGTAQIPGVEFYRDSSVSVRA